jgi:drug/metabolite transporter (DMT)-like permease
LLGERPKPMVYLALALGFVGVMVTAGGFSLKAIAPERALGIAAVLGCAVAYALSVVLLRQRAKRGDPPLTIALFQSAIPAAILALPAALFWAPIASADWPAFILIGALGLAGHVALALAFARGEASRLVAVEYTGLIWAILIGLVFFSAMLGAALIIGACWLLRR